MSDEFKNNEKQNTENNKKHFSVTIPEDDFIDSIPTPETGSSDSKPHKVVRYVDNSPKKEQKSTPEKKKTNFVGEFFACAAAGAKTVGEGISAGIKTVSEKKPHTDKQPKTEKKSVIDETKFPEKDKKVSSGKFTDKLNALPTGAVIGGAIAILIVLIAIILLVATSCAPSEKNPSSDNSSSGNIVINPSDSSDENGDDSDTPLEIPDRKTQLSDAFNANNDVVAWLYIPGLEDIDAGVCFSYDSTYPYDKRDITGKKIPNSYWINGAYYTHYRGLFGNTAEELSTNTVIFGHSDLGKENLSYTNDDPNGPLFSQLFSFKDPSFAEKTPYIYLTLPGEDTVWEVFAVFYNDSKATSSTFASYYKKGNAGDLWYIEPAPTKAEYQTMIDTMKSRSIYDYNVEVTAEDQILTLSTCTVGYGLNSRSNYRFVVVAKLVENTEELTDKNASITINANAPIPSTYQDEFNKYALNWKPSEQ